jgi:hypothetical protein
MISAGSSWFTGTTQPTGIATAICQHRANIYKKPRQVHPRHRKRLGEDIVVPAGKTLQIQQALALAQYTEHGSKLQKSSRDADANRMRASRIVLR